MAVSPSAVLRFARQLDEILDLGERTKRALDAIEIRLRELEDRVTHLEAGQAQLVTEAKAGATAAATDIATRIATTSLSDVVTRLTRIEDRTDETETSQRLPPPS